MYTLGIDIGSTTTKALILSEGREIVAYSLVKAAVGIVGTEDTAEKLFAKAGLRHEDMAYSVATGYGRQTCLWADERLSELSCHAKGAHFLFPGTRTVIDIGGQDAKILSVDEGGRLANFVMNDKCAAGTGRFLDVMAGLLNIDIAKLGDEALKSESPVQISSTCTVFAESEVISQLSAGAKIPDIVSGICSSVASRTAALAKRVGIREAVCMTGGVSSNEGVRKALERELGVGILFGPLSQMAGALGAAVIAYEKKG